MHKSCAYSDCEDRATAKGWCSMHYHRILRHGDPSIVKHRMARRLPLTASMEDRFWAKVDRNGPVPLHCPELGQCWVWIARTNRKGYGHLLPGKDSKEPKTALAHRLSWELHRGPVPDGLNVLHRCDNPPCIRPDHLFLGTKADNNADRHRKGRTVTPANKITRAKLSPGEVSALRAHYAAGSSAEALARLFGVSVGTVRDVVARRTWRDVG